LIVVLFNLLSIIILSKLLSIKLREIKRILHYLRSILDISEKEDSPIKLFYPFFRDFLLDK
jgi:hypothetical protein